MIGPIPHNAGVFAVVCTLHKRGFYTLGQGVFSTVLGRDDWPYAIKVGNGRDNWVEYVEWATAHGWAGGFAPRVYRLRRCEWGVIAIMERLERTMWNIPDDSPHREARDCLMRVNRGELLDARYPGIGCFFRRVQAAGFYGDWSFSNFMVKGPRLVLTDPSSDSGSNARRRWKAIDVVQGRAGI